MDKIKIGKTGYTIKTVEAFWNKAIVAQIDYSTKTLTLARRGGISHKPRSKTDIEQSFWHEAVHGILKDMRNPLESNEAFVDGIAIRLMKLLRQVYPNESNLVTQRVKGLRKLRTEVLRSDRLKELQVSRNRTNKIR